jgi:hypothetical protein
VTCGLEVQDIVNEVSVLSIKFGWEVERLLGLRFHGSAREGST